MDNFKTAFRKKIIDSKWNHWGVDNYDQFRFDAIETVAPSPDLVRKIKNIVKKIISYEKKITNNYVEDLLNNLNKYNDGLELLYSKLSRKEQELIVSLMAYRALGFTKIKLPRSNKEYWQAYDKAKSLKCSTDTLDPHFMHFILEKFDLKPIGFDIKLFFMYGGIAIDFLIEQYSYKIGTKTLIQAEKGDVVFDVGGCWGDTALYFADKVGESGRVFSFEFIPDNIKIHNINTQLNPHLQKRIELVANPASNITGDVIYFKDHGPGSKIETVPFEGQTGTTTTITIDDAVIKYGIEKVDFIKMDIEGAELLALHGAIETIKKYKPNLAIAIYHSMNDFVNIPKWILDLDLDYEIFIDHYTIHEEETICFAKSKSRK